MNPLEIFMISGRGLGMTLPLVFMRVVGNAILHIFIPTISTISYLDSPEV